MDMKRFFLYAISIAALALAGCGGNGGTPSPVDPPDPPIMTCPGDPGCPPDPPAATGPTDMDLAMAIFFPNKDGMGQGLDAEGRPNADGDLVAGATVVVGGDELGKDDELEEGEFMASADTPPSLGKGWAGSIHERTTKDGVTDTITVYSNKADPTAELYLDYYAVNNDYGDTRPGVESAGDNDDDVRVLTLSNVIPKAASKFFMADMFPSGGNMSLPYKDDDDTSANELKFGGTFHGVAGDFECAAVPCRATNDKDGNLVDLVGTWTFTPTKTDNVKVQGVTADPDYLQFGYWLQKETDEDGETTYTASAFAGGKGLSDMATVRQLEGSATYEGPASGLFVRKTYDATADDFVPSSSGQFTATANLTAYFAQKLEDGAGTIADSLLNSINGTVTDFMHNGQEIDSTWKVTLEKAEYGADSDLVDGMFTGDTTGDGEWRGQFYGAVEEDSDDVATGDQPTYPAGVAGEFNAHFDRGHVIGGFGAVRE